MGNICRSPTAHGVFQALLEQRGWQQRVKVDSCGTGGWHAGEPPDRRAAAAARQRGYDLSALRARQVQPDDFQRFDYILAMDRDNLQDLQAMAPADFAGVLRLFLDYAEDWMEREVPDPYYGGDKGFARVLDMVEAASRGLLEALDDAAIG
jgi:protein-tyrosine phosphatase